MFKKKSENLITNWETNPSMPEFQREKSRAIEEEYLRERYNKQEYNLPINKRSDKRYIMIGNSVYEILGEDGVYYSILIDGEKTWIRKDVLIFEEGSKIGRLSNE